MHSAGTNSNCRLHQQARAQECDVCIPLLACSCSSIWWNWPWGCLIAEHWILSKWQTSSYVNEAALWLLCNGVCSVCFAMHCHARSRSDNLYLYWWWPSLPSEAASETQIMQLWEDLIDCKWSEQTNLVSICQSGQDYALPIFTSVATFCLGQITQLRSIDKQILADTSSLHHHSKINSDKSAQQRKQSATVPSAFTICCFDPKWRCAHPQFDMWCFEQIFHCRERQHDLPSSLSESSL